LPAERFNALSDPSALRDGFKPTGTRYALAARLTGPWNRHSAGRAAELRPAAGPPTRTWRSRSRRRTS